MRIDTRRRRKPVAAVATFGLALALGGGAALGDEVAPSPREVTPLLIGDAAPAATVRTATGEEVAFSDVIAKKPTVLILYRGGW